MGKNLHEDYQLGPPKGPKMVISRQETDAHEMRVEAPLRRDSFDSFYQGQETRCSNCYNWWNRVCNSCALCGSAQYTPCLHCDFSLR